MENNHLNYVICRLSIAFIWLYHGLVPKLLGPHSDELAMNMAIGLNESQATTLAYIAGGGEMLFGLLVLLLWKKSWPILLSALLMLGLLGFVLLFYPVSVMAAFNPVTTNICVLALSVVAYRLHAST